MSSGNEENEKNTRAFTFANSCRDREIDRFWSRALYFWGFIAASFTAYITVLKLSLGDNPLNFDSLTRIDFTSKVILTVLSFVCFVFSLLWQLNHKASKFWQENWENYVCEFEEKIFENKIYGNTKRNDIETCGFPLTLKPYGYSVSKISSNSAIFLTILSFVFTVCNFINMFQSTTINSESVKIIIATIIALSAFTYTIALCFLFKRKW